jgi:hypothetical protein
MKLGPYLILQSKANFTWIKDKNVRTKTIKLLKKAGANFHNPGLVNDFFAMTSRTQQKEKI